MKKLFLCILAVTLLCTWAIAGVEDGSKPSSIGNKAPVIERAPLSQADLDKLEMIAQEQENQEAPAITVDLQELGRSFAPGVMNADRPASSFLDKSVAIPEKAEYSGPANIPDENVILQGGDVCATATAILSIPHNSVGTTAGYADDYDAVCGGGSSSSPDVVYTYTPDVSMGLTISTCNSSYDTKVFVFEDECGNVVACNDDAFYCASSNYHARIECVEVTAGHTYFIVIDGWSGAFGDYVLEITPCTPATGACCVDDVCVATTTEVGCDALGGTWYEGETCPEFQCPVIGDIVCPVEGTLFGQPPTPVDGGWSLGTSEVEVNGLNFNRYESYDVSGSILDVHWWGVKMVLDGSWQNCFEEPMTFEINFWADDGSGMPDISAPVCSYTLSAVAMPTGGLYAGIYIQYEWGVVLPEPCNLQSGWVSIQGMLDPSCWFMWASSDVGDGFSWFENNFVFESYLYDNAICLTGEYVQEFGACCDDYDGTCVDNVEAIDCLAPLRFAANTLCANIEPPCGILGACCVNDVCVATTTEADCDAQSGDWYAGETCPEFQCPLIAPNDLCEDAIPMNSGDCLVGNPAGNTIDCPGILNWYALWYEINLPYACNDVSIVICDLTGNVDGGGIVYYNDCLDCGAYNIFETYFFTSSGCLGTNSTLTLEQTGLAGGSILLPVWMYDPADNPLDFEVCVTVTDCGVEEYCDICYTNDTDDWITNVTFNTINNTTGNEGDPCSYGDYTAISTSVGQSSTHTLSVTWDSGTWTECGIAWFDWNQDFVFDEVTEAYSLGCGASGTYTVDVTVPFEALLGPTRMRVAERWNTDPAPCDMTSYGEAEDYTVIVTLGEPCVVECPPEAALEQEACGDDTNGGCNMEPGTETWEPIQCGDIVCGTTWAENDSRDTDWYELILTEPRMVTVTVEAEYPVAIFILNTDCDPTVFIETGETGPCTQFSISAALDVGSYTIWTGPGTGSEPIYNGIPCDGSGDFTNNYVLEVTCDLLPEAACCNADLDCLGDMNVYDCAALNGGWFEGETCDDFTCILFAQQGLATTGNIPDCGVSNYGPLGDDATQGNTYDWSGLGPVNYAATFVMGNSPTAMFSEYNATITDTYPFGLAGFLQMGDTFHPTAPFNDGGVLGGVGIEYCGHGFDAANPPAEADDIFVHSFTITNNGEAEVSNFYAGVYFDWDIDISTGGEDIVSFDRPRNMMYQSHSDGSYRYGLCLVNADDIGLTSLAAVSQWDYIYPTGTRPPGGWQMEHLYTIMSDGGDNIWDVQYPDMSSLISTGPHTLGAGESIVVNIAVIGGATIADMEAGAELAATLEIPDCEPPSGSPCGNYVVGDYNGSGTFNVADIIAGFSKLKTGAPDAALLCDCEGDGNIWAVAMDVNNSCAFNVADIIAGFSKLKTGSPELVPCELCPPEGGSPRGGGDRPSIVPNLESKAKLSTGSGME